MFQPTSRYAELATTDRQLPDGRTVRFSRRRLLPPAGTQPAVAEITPTDTDRLDLIAARILGDPEQYWRLCDANNVMNPADAPTRPGQRLRIPLDGPGRGAL